MSHLWFKYSANGVSNFVPKQPVPTSSRMSTKYFILSKNPSKSVADDDNTQLYSINSSLTCILPSTNMDYYAKHGLFEKNLIEWSKQLCSKDKNILDIGAHTGTYSLCLAPYAKHVYSFEPQKMTYYALCGSVALSNATNVTCHPVGLGSESQVGIKDLYIRSQDGGGSSVHLLGDPVLASEKIEIRTLDSYKYDSIGFIKMDVEDNELFVLQGAAETIRRCGHPKILFESNHENKALFDYITNSLGYRSIVQIGGVSNMFLAE